MNKKAIFGIALSVALLLPVSVLAHGETGKARAAETTEDSTDTDTTRIQELREQHEAQMEAIREQRKARLEGAKLQLCERRQDVIKKNIDKSVEQAQKHMDVFTKIADRVIAFANDNNRKPDNFDALVAEVNAKKTAAQAAIDAAGTADFDCTSDAPKGQIEAFRATFKSMKSALKEYRTSIKNLIVGVKNTQPTTETESEGAEQ